jgi:serine protease Do
MTISFGEVAERLRRATVHVECGGRGGSGGSGVIRSAGGLILTNAHVVRSDKPSVLLWDGRRIAASLAARDSERDLAVLRIGADDLPAAEFRDTSALRPGELVLAVGNPLGFTGAVSTGVVHSVGPVQGMGRQDWIRASVRLAPGNSGGPLADAQGRVIGINTAIVHGLGLAVPSDAIRAFLRQGSRPKLGVALRPVGIGLLVLDVAARSPAADASIWVGDILTDVDGRPLRDASDLARAMDGAAGVVHIAFLRGDRAETRHTAVRVGAAKAEAA